MYLYVILHIQIKDGTLITQELLYIMEAVVTMNNLYFSHLMEEHMQL